MLINTKTTIPQLRFLIGNFEKHQLFEALHNVTQKTKQNFSLKSFERQKFFDNPLKPGKTAAGHILPRQHSDSFHSRF